MLDTLVLDGEAAIDSMLNLAEGLSALIDSKFAARSLEEVEAHFTSTPKPAEGKMSVNPEVSDLLKLVREHAVVACDKIKAAELWIAMKSPAVSDGNNFGVDVQNYVYGELKSMRHAIQAIADDALSNYHWQRANGLEKLKGGTKTEQSESESVKTENKKETEKAETVTTKNTDKKMSKTIEPQIYDYDRYVLAMDVKHYNTAHCHLIDIRNCYVKAHLLFSKNMKRLSDPRGEGESGGRTNVMSMF